MHHKILVRLIARSRELYLLKVVILAIAFASFILVLRFAVHEYGYDKFHDAADSVFRVLQRNEDASYYGNRWSAQIPRRIHDEIKSTYRDSMIVSRLKILRGVNVRSGHHTSLNQKIHAVDASIDKVFSIDVIDGSQYDFNTSTQPVVMISARAAYLYMGSVDVAGQSLDLFTFGDTLSTRIAAVYADFPDNTHDDFDVLLRYDSASLQTIHFDKDESLVYGRSSGKSPSQFFLSDLNDIKVPGELRSGTIKYSLQALPEIYFGPRVLNEEARHGDRYSMVILLCTTCLILFLSIASYVNLTTITLPHRAKEFAIRKLAGKTNGELLFDFFMESLVLVLLSLFTGIVILFLTARYWEYLLGMNTRVIFDTLHFETIAGVVTLVIVFSMTPLLLMRKFANATAKRLLSTDVITFDSLRSVMAFLQLGIGIFLIVVAVVVRRQINYSLVKEPGANHDQIVYLNSPANMTVGDVATLRANWKRTHPNIIDVMAVSQLPDRISSREINSPFFLLEVDPGFLDFFKLRMDKGNWFKANDGDSIIVTNRTGMEAMMSGVGEKYREPGNVIGEVQDPGEMFNHPSKPLKIKLAQNQVLNWLCIRVLEVDIRKTVEELSAQFAVHGRKVPVRYLDSSFASWINYQDRLNRLSGALAVISIILSCAAIYGLSVSIVRDKMKQLAVHHLFGAGTLRLTYLLVRWFARQAFVALMIFGPLIYIAMRELLRTFVYATRLSWIDLLYPVGYCVFVIFFVCLFQALSLNRSDFASALKTT